MDDRPEHLAGVVGVDGEPIEVVGVDVVAHRARRPVASRLPAKGPPAVGRRPVADDQAAHLVGYSARAWSTIASTSSGDSSTNAGPGWAARLTSMAGMERGSP